MPDGKTIRFLKPLSIIPFIIVDVMIESFMNPIRFLQKVQGAKHGLKVSRIF